MNGFYKKRKAIPSKLFSSNYSTNGVEDANRLWHERKTRLGEKLTRQMLPEKAFLDMLELPQDRGNLHAFEVNVDSIRRPMRPRTEDLYLLFCPVQLRRVLEDEQETLEAEQGTLEAFLLEAEQETLEAFLLEAEQGPLEAEQGPLEAEQETLEAEQGILEAEQETLEARQSHYPIDPSWLPESEQKPKRRASKKKKKSKRKRVYDAKQKGRRLKYDDFEVNLGSNHDEEEPLLQGNCHATGANVDCDNQLRITQGRPIDAAAVVSQYDQQETLEAHQRNYPIDLKDTILAWFFVVTNFILEIPLLVFNQLGSAKQLYYAFFVMLISAITLMICIVELICEGKRGRYIWKWEGRGPIRKAIPWFYCPETKKPLGSLGEFIGLASAVPQFIINAINYSYIYRHSDGPINISILPLIFAFGLLCSKCFERSKNLRGRNRNAQNEANIWALNTIIVEQ